MAWTARRIVLCRIIWGSLFYFKSLASNYTDVLRVNEGKMEVKMEDYEKADAGHKPTIP
jgi:hypothetical protein